VTLSVRVEADGPLAVESYRPGDPTGWRVRSAGEPTTAPLAGGRQRWEQSYRLVPDRPGELPLPLPPVRARAAGRESVVELAFEPLAVRVTTELPRADLDEARGVTGPEPVPPGPPSFLASWLAAALGGVAVLGGALWWRARRRHAPPPEPAAADWLAAELKRLEALDPAAADAADALSDTARGYLARRYRVGADGRTTAELVALLPPEAAGPWRALLERCDLAKFARAGFTAQEWAGALASLRISERDAPTSSSLPSGERGGSTS
jgi:hypothetical protein